MNPSDDSSAGQIQLNPSDRGTPFGRFRLLDRIGTGDVAEVFRAIVVGVEGFERRVAIKVMRGDVAENEVGRLFAEEARVTAMLDHAGVVQVYEFGVIESAPYIAMEYIRGKNLAEVLSGLRALNERLPPALAVFIATELATALAHAHESEDNHGLALRIVHAGIAPANVMLGREGAVKLLDFGVWPLLAAPQALVTREGRRVPPHAAYLSPEQALGEEIDEGTDLFSLGVVMWEMLTGRPLFPGKSERQTLKNVLHADIPPPSSFAPEVPPSLDDIVLTALSRDRARRYRGASDLGRDLEEVALTLPRRHGDLGALIDRLSSSPHDSGSMRTLAVDAAADKTRTPAPREPSPLSLPRPHAGDRAPTTKMMGDTTLAAILARDPRRKTKTTLLSRMRSDPKSLLVATGGLVAGLLIAAALMTGRSKPIAHPTDAPTAPVTVPAVPNPNPPVAAPTPVAATPLPVAPLLAPDAGPARTPAPELAAPPPPAKPAPAHRRRPPGPRAGQRETGDHRPNPF